MSTAIKRAKRKIKANGLLLPARDWETMLESFPKMSLHDQAAIFLLIRARAKANAQKSGRSA